MLTFGRARVNCRQYRQSCNTVAAACYSCPRLRDRTARAVRKSSTDPVGAELSDRPSVRLPDGRWRWRVRTAATRRLKRRRRRSQRRTRTDADGPCDGTGGWSSVRPSVWLRYLPELCLASAAAARPRQRRRFRSVKCTGGTS